MKKMIRHPRFYKKIIESTSDEILVNILIMNLMKILIEELR